MPTRSMMVSATAPRADRPIYDGQRYPGLRSAPRVIAWQILYYAELRQRRIFVPHHDNDRQPVFWTPIDAPGQPQLCGTRRVGWLIRLAPDTSV